MDLNFNKNEDYNKLQLSDLRKKLAKVKLGGGQKGIDKHHAKGKMTARERIDYLLDPKSDSIEIGAFAGDGMYEEHGGCPSGGVVVKIGYVQGKQCVVVANDATVKAGAWFPITGKKNLRAQEIAIENRLPVFSLDQQPVRRFSGIAFKNMTADLAANSLVTKSRADGQKCQDDIVRLRWSVQQIETDDVIAVILCYFKQVAPCQNALSDYLNGLLFVFIEGFVIKVEK